MRHVTCHDGRAGPASDSEARSISRTGTDRAEGMVPPIRGKRHSGLVERRAEPRLVVEGTEQADLLTPTILRVLRDLLSDDEGAEAPKENEAS